MIRALILMIAVTAAAPMASSKAAEPEPLVSKVARKAAILGVLHRSASRALVTAAQDATFKKYLSGDKSQKSKIDQIMLSVQRKFPIEEMCLIHEHGHEIARIFDRMIAPDAELSQDETGAPFFAPTFAKPPREVHVSRVYMSPDAHEWVVAYATPIAHGADKPVILHFEQSLKRYRDQLGKGETGSAEYVLAVDRDGWIVADSRGDASIERKGIDPSQGSDPAGYFHRLSGPLASAIEHGKSKSGHLQAGDGSWSFAQQPVEDWTIVVVRKDK